MKNRPPTPIADSPWFWFMLFLGVGLTFLIVTDGRFKRRQAGIERKYQVDEWVRALKAKGEWEGDDTATAFNADGSPKETTVPIPEYSTPGNTRIQIGALKVALGGFWIVCAGMFVRERLLQRGDSGEAQLPSEPTP